MGTLKGAYEAGKTLHGGSAQLLILRDHCSRQCNHKEMLFNSQAIARSWHQTKKVIGDTWNHATKLAGQFDHGMRVGRKLLSAVVPMFDSLGATHHLKPLMSGIKAYDQGRSDVMYGYNNVLKHYQRMKRQVPEVDL